MKKYDNYKDSGIEWIGEIPRHWKVKRLKNIGTLYSGLSGKSGSDFEKTPTENYKPFINFTNIANNKYVVNHNFGYVKIDENETQNKVKKNDLFFLMSSENQDDVGKSALLIDNYEELYLNSFCKGFRININFEAKFLNYLLSSSVFSQLISLEGRGFTRINLRMEGVENLPIILPESIDEQTAIANYLDHKTTQIDTLITKKEQFISLLQEERTAVINQAVTKGLDPKVKLKDSGIEWLGEIPEHWEVKRLKYCFQIFGGFAFSSSDFTNEGVQIVKIGNLYQNQLSLDRAPTFVNRKFVNTHPNFLASQGDILMSLTGTLGKRDYGYAILVKNEDELMVNQRVALIKANNDMCIDFSINMFHCELYLNQLYKIPTGTKQGNLSCEDVLSISMAIPSKEEQLKIGEYLKQKSNEIETLISKSQQEIELLKEYKTALISEVVTGKVDVRDVILN